VSRTTRRRGGLLSCHGPSSWNDIVQLAIAHSDLDNFYFVISQRGRRGAARGGKHACGRRRGSGCDVCIKKKRESGMHERRIVVLRTAVLYVWRDEEILHERR